MTLKKTRAEAQAGTVSDYYYDTLARERLSRLYADADRATFVRAARKAARRARRAAAASSAIDPHFDDAA